MSDTDKITSAHVDEEYTSTIGIFPDNITIQKGATTHDLTRTKLEAFKVAFSFRRCITVQSNYM